MSKMIDISQELIVCRYQNGIKLLSPERLALPPSQHSSLRPIPIKPVAEVMRMPFGVFFFGNDFNVNDINEACLDSHNIYSKMDLVGYTVAKISNNKEEINKLQINNEHVVKTNQISVIKENLSLFEDKNIHTVSFKMPWYDENNNVSGVFGCSALVRSDRLDAIANHFVSISNMFHIY